MSRDMRCTYNGRDYVIPEICIMGFIAGHRGATTEDAIRWWDYQARLEDGTWNDDSHG